MMWPVAVFPSGRVVPIDQLSLEHLRIAATLPGKTCPETAPQRRAIVQHLLQEREQ